MAYTPSDEEIKKIQAESAEAIENKIKSQEKQGKTFVDNGQGVIPEDAWKKLAGKTEAE